MAKRKTKNKSMKKLKKTVTTVLIILIILFVVACYFYPPLYGFVLKLFSREDEPEYRVEGDITYIESGVMPDLKVHFVDVGQGDAIIIELPDGKNVIIDAGIQYGKDNTEYNLSSYIKTKTSVDSFDYAIATHADSDHIGNFDKILEEFEVKKIFRPHVLYTGAHFTFSTDFNKGGNDGKQPSKNYGEFLNAIQNETYVENGVTKSAEWEFFTHESDFAGKISYEGEIYEYYFDFLTPRVDSFNSISYKNANDYSPIIKFTYQEVDILLTGDAEGGTEGDAEDDFVAYYKNLTDYDLDVEILKVGHHGSRTSTTQELLDLVKPEYAVIQCGEDNSYKHPHQETLDRLFDLNCTLYRNDKHGDVVLTVTKESSFTFATEKQNNSGLFVGGDAQ